MEYSPKRGVRGIVRAFGFRCTSKIAPVKACLMPTKAWFKELSHVRCSVIEVRSELSGSRILAQPGRS